MAASDLRIGLDMVMRAALTAEQAARTAVTVEDVLAAYSLSRHLHAEMAVGALTAGERADLAAALAVGREGTAVSGKVYERVCAGGRISYTTFHERLRKLEHLRLVDPGVVRQEKGRMRVIEVREGVEEVLAPVPAGSSGVPVTCAAGVCDDEKC